MAEITLIDGKKIIASQGIERITESVISYKSGNMTVSIPWTSILMIRETANEVDKR